MQSIIVALDRVEERTGIPGEFVIGFIFALLSVAWFLGMGALVS